MKIEIRIEPPRLLTGRSKRWWAVAVALAMALAVAVPVAWASDLFGDVPNSNPFHDDIGAIARSGVTKGCSATTPPNYCPSDNVTREAMAAFMHRGFTRVGATFNANVAITAGVDTVFLSQPITVGLPNAALSGAAQFLNGSADVSFATWANGTTPTAANCSATTVCEVRVWMTIDGSSLISQPSYATIQNGQIEVVNVANHGVAPVTTPGVHTVALHVREITGSTPLYAYGNLVVTNVPFGSTGTNTP
jgi:hypothetical protein